MAPPTILDTFPAPDTDIQLGLDVEPDATDQAVPPKPDPTTPRPYILRLNWTMTPIVVSGG